MKAQRWYRREGDFVCIYDHPHPDKALSVSIVKESDLEFYRRSFHLTKTWERS